MNSRFVLFCVAQCVAVVAAEPKDRFFTSFESSDANSSSDGLQGWSASPGVSVTNTTAAAGANSVLLPAGRDVLLARQFPLSALREPTFIDFYLRPAVGQTPSDSTFVELGVSGLGFVRTSSGTQVLAFDGDNTESGRWIPITAASPADTWLRITIRQDFANQRRSEEHT